MITVIDNYNESAFNCYDGMSLGDAVNSIKGLTGNCDHRFYDEGLVDACSELIGLTTPERTASSSMS